MLTQSSEARDVDVPFEMDTTTKSYARQLIRTGNLPRELESTNSDRMLWLPEDRQAVIVDVGCGWGSLLLDLRQRGYENLLGVEGDAEIAREADRRCGENTNRIGIVHSEAITFFEHTSIAADRVLLFHVLEHFSAKHGTRLLKAVRERLKDGGRIVIEVPNMSSVTGMNMQCSDLTHATAFTEYSLRQLLDDAGFENASVICSPPALRWWRIGRQGSGLAWHLNHWIHSVLYKVTNSGPRPNCFCPALLVTAAK